MVIPTYLLILSNFKLVSCEIHFKHMVFALSLIGPGCWRRRTLWNFEKCCGHSCRYVI